MVLRGTWSLGQVVDGEQKRADEDVFGCGAGACQQPNTDPCVSLPTPRHPYSSNLIASSLLSLFN